jgi:hypothetical protein
MSRKFLSVILAALLAFAPFSVQSLAANSSAEKEARRTEKVRATIHKLGVGEAARVAVKLRDKTKLAGYISALNEETFTIMEIATGKATVVAYPAVAQVKGHNLSTGAKIAIIGLAAGVALLAFFLWLENAD